METPPCTCYKFSENEKRRLEELDGEIEVSVSDIAEYRRVLALKHKEPFTSKYVTWSDIKNLEAKLANLRTERDQLLAPSYKSNCSRHGN